MAKTRRVQTERVAMADKQQRPLPHPLMREILQRLDELAADVSATKKLVETLTRKGTKMSVQIDNLTAQVKANKDVTDSAVVLLNGLAARIEALKTDPVALQALADELKAQDDTLAAAVVANTPAVP